MTPEDDVNDELEKNTDGEAVSSDSAEAAAGNDSATDSSDNVVNEQVAGDETDEAIDGADASNAESAADIDDDPLGFGKKRMDGDSEEQSELQELQAQLAAAEEKAAKHWDQLLRLQADMENQRKRAQNDISKAHKFALENFANELLPVKDSLEAGLLAATAEEAEATKIIEGTEMTLKLLSQALEKHKIVEINPIDEKFDPEFHQAMSMQEVEGKEPNTVASVMQKGYTLNDRLIRPALVMVAK
jgi:molecular chaperone GrpE